MGFYLSKQSQKSRFILQTGSKYFESFWRGKPQYTWGALCYYPKCEKVPFNYSKNPIRTAKICRQQSDLSTPYVEQIHFQGGALGHFHSYHPSQWRSTHKGKNFFPL